MTLSTAKLLKENGWIKETIEGYCGCSPQYVHLKYGFLKHTMEGEIMFFPAPSTDELLAELNKVTLTKVGNNYSAIYFGDSPMDCRAVEDLTDPTECLALLWIKLKQENIGG